MFINKNIDGFQGRDIEIWIFKGGTSGNPDINYKLIGAQSCNTTEEKSETRISMMGFNTQKAIYGTSSYSASITMIIKDLVQIARVAGFTDSDLESARSLVLDDFEKINIFANRGYRYAHFNVGMLSENIYLTATALGLAVRGIGNFFDDSLNTFLRVREPHENVLGGVIVGRS